MPVDTWRYDIATLLILTFTGLFYVIDGFLDILLPIDKKSQTNTEEPNYGGQNSPRAGAKRDPQQKLLFTVKAGGIAGYLGKRVMS
jgi:hypothetical protein